MPAGNWEVHLRYAEQGRGGSSGGGSHVIGTVELVEGEVREQTFDLGYLLKAEIEGAVTLDGKPLENGGVTFEGKTTRPDGTSARVLKQSRPLGVGGTFTLAVWPGEYRPIVEFLRDGRSQIMHGVGVVKVSAGQKVSFDVTLQSSVLKLRVLGYATDRLRYRISRSAFRSLTASGTGRRSRRTLSAAPRSKGCPRSKSRSASGRSGWRPSKPRWPRTIPARSWTRVFP